jgi:integrase
MARKLEMTWNAKRKGWLKNFKGKIYNVSCRQLGVPPTKEASWERANAWWLQKKLQLDAQPDQAEQAQDQAAAAFRVWSFMQDFDKLDTPTRRAFYDSFVGEAGAYDRLKADVEAKADRLLGQPADAEKTVDAQVKKWGRTLQAAVAARQISEGRYDAYLRHLKIFSEWVGPETPVQAIDADKLNDWFLELCSRVHHLTYSKDYAHGIFGATRQWIAWVAERGVMPLPPNLRSRRFKFKNGGKKVVTFSDDEVKKLLAACDGFSGRTKLYLLLGLNCGTLQNDIAELEDGEVNLDAGTLTRPRSKTPDGPTVTYKLWPETAELLRKYKAKAKVPGERGGNLFLLTERGVPLVKYWLEDGKQRRYDVIQSAWSRLMERVDFHKPFKVLRKTASTKLGDHSLFKFYAGYFLGHSPRSVDEKSYVKPSDREFFEACDWLRTALLGSAGG